MKRMTEAANERRYSTGGSTETSIQPVRYMVGKLSRQTQDGEKIIAILYQRIPAGENRSATDEILAGTIQCLSYFRSSLENKKFIVRTSAAAAEALKDLSASSQWAQRQDWLSRQRFVVEQTKESAIGNQGGE